MRKKVAAAVLKKIRLLAMDVDGVLAESILLGNNGQEFKNYDAQDGAGIKYWRRAGRLAAIITGRESDSVSRRAEELGVDFLYQRALNKANALDDLLKKTGLSHEEIAYIGDDLPDLPILLRVGLPIAVPNARPEVKSRAAIVTKQTGGKGAVREIIEMLLKAQEKWNDILKKYLEI